MFLAILFPLYYLVPKRFQWMLLLAASYVFYAFAGWGCLIFIAVTTVTCWYASLQMDRLQKRQSAYLKARKEALTSEEKKAYKARVKKKKLGWFLAALLLNFGILAVLKYTNFAIVNINAISALFGGGQLQLVDLLLQLLPCVLAWGQRLQKLSQKGRLLLRPLLVAP